MLYTLMSPSEARDRILLFPSVEAARAQARRESDVRTVAVGFDALMRRLIPLWTDPSAFDPTWSTPAQPHPDGSVTAKGPIPEPLFHG